MKLLKTDSYLKLFSLVLGLGSGCVLADSLFSDNFESDVLKTSGDGFKWSSPVYTSIIGPTSSVATNSFAKSSGTDDNSNSLEFVYKATDEATDSWSEQRFSLGGYYKDIWVSYDFFVPTNYYHRTTSGSNNNKGFLMMWSDDYSKPTGPKIGPEFWPNADGSSKASIRLSGVGFDKHFWAACPSVIKLSDRGQWIKIVAHYKYASEANNDGIAQIWKIYKDGARELACNITDGAWYYPTAPGFNNGYILGWSNSGFNEETKFRVDNFEVSTDSLLTNPPLNPGNPKIISQ